MCYYSKLENSGGRCRTCLVEVSKGSEADPRPMPKLVASCRTTVMDGMEVKTLLLKKRKKQESRYRIPLLNHPLDCPICDQAGECHLQDLGYEHGLQQTRNDFRKNTYDADDL